MSLPQLAQPALPETPRPREIPGRRETRTAPLPPPARRRRSPGRSGAPSAAVPCACGPFRSRCAASMRRTAATRSSSPNGERKRSSPSTAAPVGDPTSDITTTIPGPPALRRNALASSSAPGISAPVSTRSGRSSAAAWEGLRAALGNADAPSFRAQDPVEALQGALLLPDDQDRGHTHYLRYEVSAAFLTPRLVPVNRLRIERHLIFEGFNLPGHCAPGGRSLRDEAPPPLRWTAMHRGKGRERSATPRAWVRVN